MQVYAAAKVGGFAPALGATQHKTGQGSRDETKFLVTTKQKKPLPIVLLRLAPSSPQRYCSCCRSYSFFFPTIYASNLLEEKRSAGGWDRGWGGSKIIIQAVEQYSSHTKPTDKRVAIEQDELHIAGKKDKTMNAESHCTCECIASCPRLFVRTSSGGLFIILRSSFRKFLVTFRVF